jgi:Protein of unknown function (DUF1353)
MIVSTPTQFVQPEIQGTVTDQKLEYTLVSDYGYMWLENDTIYIRRVFATDPITGKKWTTDLASTPGFAGLLNFKPCGPSDGGAILHDRGYEVFGELKLGKFPDGEFQKQENGVWVNCDEPWTRLRCDKLYYNMCVSGGMSVWRARTEFLALRIGAISKRNGLRWYFS